MTAGKYTDCLMAKDNPSHHFSLRLPSPFPNHSCSWLLLRNHFANCPFSPFCLPSPCVCIWSSPFTGLFFCGLSFCCVLLTPSSHPHPGVLSQTWMLWFHFPFLLCPGEIEISLQLPPGTCAGRVQFLDSYWFLNGWTHCFWKAYNWIMLDGKRQEVFHM